MAEKKVLIDTLQPSDVFHIDSLSFLELLSCGSLNYDFGLPEVWSIGGLNVISDGNNRLALLSLRGVEKALVDFKTLDNACPEFVPEIIQILKDAYELQNRGIYRPIDLTYWK